MAKIKIAGGAMVIESTATMETLKTLEKYRPNSLCLFDKDGNKTFVVGTSAGGGSVTKYGVSFSGTSKTAEKKACITMAIPDDVTNVETYVEEAVGVAILNLNNIEKQFADALAEVELEKEAIRENITVL